MAFQPDTSRIAIHDASQIHVIGLDGVEKNIQHAPFPLVVIDRPITNVNTQSAIQFSCNARVDALFNFLSAMSDYQRLYAEVNIHFSLFKKGKINPVPFFEGIENDAELKAKVLALASSPLYAYKRAVQITRQQLVHEDPIVSLSFLRKEETFRRIEKDLIDAGLNFSILPNTPAINGLLKNFLSTRDAKLQRGYVMQFIDEALRDGVDVKGKEEKDKNGTVKEKLQRSINALPLEDRILLNHVGVEVFAARKLTSVFQGQDIYFSRADLTLRRIGIMVSDLERSEGFNINLFDAVSHMVAGRPRYEGFPFAETTAWRDASMKEIQGLKSDQNTEGKRLISEERNVSASSKKKLTWEYVPANSRPEILLIDMQRVERHLFSQGKDAEQIEGMMGKGFPNTYALYKGYMHDKKMDAIGVVVQNQGWHAASEVAREFGIEMSFGLRVNLAGQWLSSRLHH